MCQIPDHRWHIQRILGRLQSCLSTSSKWHYTVMRTAGKYNIDNTISRCWTSTAVAAHRFSSSIASIPWQTFNDLERTALRFLLRLCIKKSSEMFLETPRLWQELLESTLSVVVRPDGSQHGKTDFECSKQDYNTTLWGRSVLQLVS